MTETHEIAKEAARRILRGLANAEANDAVAAWYQFVSADDVETVARVVAEEQQNG